MKYLEIEHGNDPDYAKLKRHGITGCIFDARDPRLTAAYLKSVKDKGYAVGVKVADSAGWPEVTNGTGKQCAEWMDARVDHITILDQPSFPKTQFDLERHDPTWIQDCLTRWRELRPKQDTSWTFEGGQSGWMSPSFMAKIKGLNVRLAPQLYNGDMTEVWDSLAYTRELTAIGFEDARISPFYDAAHLPVGWSGYAFSMGRLP